MATTIEDGTGKGFSAGVDSENRLLVRTINETEFDHATRKGSAYNINTLFFSVTDSVERPLLYLKNNEEKTLTLAAWFFATSGSSSSNGIIKMFPNPSSGTIISSGTDVEAVNRLIGSSNTLDADIKRGGDGFTATGYGTEPVLYQPQGATSRGFGSIQIAIEPGSSVVINYDPNGQEPFQIYVGFQVYLAESEN